MSRTAAKKRYRTEDLEVQTAGVECRKDKRLSLDKRCREIHGLGRLQRRPVPNSSEKAGGESAVWIP